MKRCARCKCLKPDASFYVGNHFNAKAYEELTPEHRKKRDRCLHCRTIFREMGFHTRTPPRPIEPFEESPNNLVYRSVFREEFERFKERGSPGVKRVYTHLPRSVIPSRINS